MKSYKAIAEYYDPENERHPMLHEDIPFLLNHLPRKPQHILELATGTARAAIPLAQAGHRVLGVDYAPDMLAIARRKCAAVGLAPPQLQLLHRDVLTLNLHEKFDWVCILFNTFLGFTTLSQQDRLLQMVRRHLKPRGHFWLDIFQPNLHLLSQNSRNLEPFAFHVPSLERTVVKTTEIKPDPANQLQRIIFHYRWFDAQGQEHRQRTTFDLTFLFPRELQLLLERNGLKIEHLYGNYDGSPIDSNSPRIIASCKLA